MSVRVELLRELRNAGLDVCTRNRVLKIAEHATHIAWQDGYKCGRERALKGELR